MKSVFKISIGVEKRGDGTFDRDRVCLQQVVEPIVSPLRRRGPTTQRPRPVFYNNDFR